MKNIMRSFLVMVCALAASCSNNNQIKIGTADLEITLNEDGVIESAFFPKLKEVRAIEGHSSVKHCRVVHVKEKKLGQGGATFTKTVLDTVNNREFQLTETFSPTPTSIRWEIEIIDEGENWSSPIETNFAYPISEEVTHWLPWADPRGDISDGGTDNALIANAIINSGDLSDFTSWADPLVSLPMEDNLWHYGAPRYEYENPGILYCPFQGDVISIPMIGFLEKNNNMGLSLVLSPEDTLLDIDMATTKEGRVTFSRYNHRMGKGKKLKFSMDLVPHQADWRSSLGWVVARYTSYFYPTNPLAKEISGTGAYSNNDASFDVDKMNKMAFKVNWRASFDFPYMGMFIPPVDSTTFWSSFVRERNLGKIRRRPTSIPKMRDYCKNMDENGFYVLSYFNVTEFGTQIEYPRPESSRTENSPKWMDANDYLYEELADAMLFVPEAQKPVLDKGIYSARPGQPFWTWEKAVAMDPGVASYQNFLIEQAKRSVEALPQSYGISIDRMDWTRFYNHNTDDGVSWMGDQPVGSLYLSWMDIMEKLHPIFHHNNKVIYVNNHVKRIEQLKHVDGIFDEFTYAGASLNAIALLGNQKPVLGWLSNDQQLLPDPDEVMQKFLYMGVFPMAPFPGNDHSIRPSELADRVYLDYGPLFEQLRGKEWVLEPHVITTEGNAKVNLFKTFGGYTVPITYAGENDSVQLTIRKQELVKDGLEIYAYYPGVEEPTKITSEIVNETLVLKVPVQRNCAVLKIED